MAVEAMSCERVWEQVEGEWILSNHARSRAESRFGLDDRDINELMDNLEKGAIVKVPEANPRDGFYVAQTSISKGSLFVSVAEGTKVVTTLLPPFCRFRGEIPGTPMTASDFSPFQPSVSDQANVLASGAIVKVMVPMYKSGTGKLFETPEEAKQDQMKDQLGELLAKLGYFENDDGIANDLIDDCISNAEALIRILQGGVVFPYNN